MALLFFVPLFSNSIRRYYWKKFPLRGKEGAKDFPTKTEFFWPFRYANPIQEVKTMQQTNPMRMEKRRLADLIPAAYNPRKALTPADPEYQDGAGRKELRHHRKAMGDVHRAES